jgi:hypothetical protein
MNMLKSSDLLEQESCIFLYHLLIHTSPDNIIVIIIIIIIIIIIVVVVVMALVGFEVLTAVVMKSSVL